MKLEKSFLWLGGVFDEKTVSRYPAVSPAANFWQRGFVEALIDNNQSVHVIGHAAERMWPFGRLIVSASGASFPSKFTGQAVGYLNIPRLRGAVQYANYLRLALAHIEKTRLPDSVVTFSCLFNSNQLTPDIRTAKHLQKRYGIPWINVIADGVAPLGADGYVYQRWSDYCSKESFKSKLHLDGGVPSVKNLGAYKKSKNIKAFMYMGALTAHGGVTFLARSFTKLIDSDVELWVCGRGENEELQLIANRDKRIKVFGYVSEERLNDLANTAYAFVNPRPSDFAPNKQNYPSKLLHYLAYGKPVISTWSDGLSPDYADCLVEVEDETEEGLMHSIKVALNLSTDQIHSMSDKIESFNRAHSWSYQIKRFLTWLED